MRVVEPRAIFTSLDEASVLAALNDSDSENPIAVEVARLIEGYMQNVQELVKRLGYIPADVLRRKPGCPIEAVAMRLTGDAIRDCHKS